MTQPLLELRQITVSFDGFLALRDLNLSLQPGELRAVIGPNGAGKTTGEEGRLKSKHAAQGGSSRCAVGKTKNDKCERE